MREFYSKSLELLTNLHLVLSTWKETDQYVVFLNMPFYALEDN